MAEPSPFLQALIAPANAPAAETAGLAGPIIIQPFAQWCQQQPAGSNWCWAAVGKAMAGFARALDLSLQQIALEVRTPPPNLLFAIDIRSVLDILGIGRSPPLNLYGNGAAIAPAAISSGTPLAISISWFGMAPGSFESVGHVIAAFGWDQQSHRLLIFDPNTIGTSSDIIRWVPISEMSHYLEGALSGKFGTWGDGFAVARNAS